MDEEDINEATEEEIQSELLFSILCYTFLDQTTTITRIKSYDLEI